MENKDDVTEALLDHAPPTEAEMDSVDLPVSHIIDMRAYGDKVSPAALAAPRLRAKRLCQSRMSRLRGWQSPRKPRPQYLRWVWLLGRCALRPGRSAGVGAGTRLVPAVPRPRNQGT